MTRELRIGSIGLGYIGRVHTIAYQDIPLVFEKSPVTARLAVVLRSQLRTNEEAMSLFALATTDLAEFYAQSLDLVDVCSPNCLHREHVEPALRAGTAVYCEKPLAATLGDARAMADLAAQTGTLTQVAFVLRYLPAVRQMKALIEAGEIGEVFHFRAHLLHGSYVDTERPMSWRLRCAESGGGAFMDLGAHLVDLTHYLLGEVATVRAITRTFVCQRCAVRGTEEREVVDVDDWTLCTVELKRGAVGVLEATRVAAGARDATAFDVYGSKGALRFAISDPDYVEVFHPSREQWIKGPMSLPPPEGERAIGEIWPGGKYSQGTMTNAHLAAAYDFLLNVAEGKPSRTDFQAGLAAQEVVTAAYTSAEHGGELIRLPL
jgi:predicted dehydrogenase